MSSKQFYRDYIVKVHGNGISRLVGINSLIAILGEFNADRLLLRIENMRTDTFRKRYRRGITVSVWRR